MLMKVIAPATRVLFRILPWSTKSYVKRIIHNSSLWQHAYRASIQTLSRHQSLLRRSPRVILECTNLCNAHCAQCPRTYMTRGLGAMDLGFFKKLVDQCVQWRVADMCLSNFGEPLLDRHIFERVQYAKQAGIQSVSMFTNASLLDEQACVHLLDAGLDHLEVSIDGYSDEIYGALRPPLQLKKIKANLHWFIELKNSRNSKTTIGVNFVRTRVNYDEYQDFVSYWRHYVDRVDSVDANYWGGILKGKVDTKRWSAKSQVYFPCYRLWSELTVLWDGRVSICCQDFDGAIILGDATRESLEGIWRGRMITELRAIHRKSALSDISLCKDCLIGREPLGWFSYLLSA